MIYFKWKDEYELGLPHIDLQHTMIVNMINELFVALGSSEADYTTRKTLDNLLLYVEEHFASEEAAMHESHYPDIEDHLKEHEELRGKVQQMYDRHQAEGRIAASELIEFLKEWFQNHIADVDKRFGLYVNAQSDAAKKSFFE